MARATASLVGRMRICMVWRNQCSNVLLVCTDILILSYTYLRELNSDLRPRLDRLLTHKYLCRSCLASIPSFDTPSHMPTSFLTLSTATLINIRRHHDRRTTINEVGYFVSQDNYLIVSE